ncbi:hypothetical protein GCM10011418_26050 [Sphingobacterium alkalisoli]|nr:hypothetical protein GCM10011418_26050 [Sphingobacterium alkalisoli]
MSVVVTRIVRIFPSNNVRVRDVVFDYFAFKRAFEKIHHFSIFLKINTIEKQGNKILPQEETISFVYANPTFSYCEYKQFTFILENDD